MYIQESKREHFERKDIVDFIKGICAVWVILLHAIPGGGYYKVLLMPFTAQLTIPFFMTMTGYNWSASYQRRRVWWRDIGRRAKRILIPVIPVLTLELFIQGTPDNWLFWLMQGGYTYPGSYYIIILLQLLVFFPVIFKLADVIHWRFGLLLVMMLHLLYELLMFRVGVRGEIYRLLVLRYSVFLYCGCLLTKQHTFIRNIRWLLPFSAAYIFVTGYMGYKPSVLFRYEPWYKTAALTAFWVVPAVAFVLEHQKILQRMRQVQLLKILMDGLILIGQSSYHIYLVQMLWFGMVCNIYLSSMNKIFRFILSLAISVPMGLGFRYLITFASACMPTSSKQ